MELKILSDEEILRRTEQGENRWLMCEAQAQCTLREVVEWGHGQCTEHGVPVMRRSCMLCWYELRELADGH